MRRRATTAQQPTDPVDHPAFEFSGDYFAALVQGRIELWKVYWIWNVLIGGIGGSLLIRGFGEIGLALLMTYSFVVLVALWNSAGRYAGPYIWAVLSRLVVVLGALNIVLIALLTISN